jgi:hypothetical protein
MLSTAINFCALSAFIQTGRTKNRKKKKKNKRIPHRHHQHVNIIAPTIPTASFPSIPVSCNAISAWSTMMSPSLTVNLSMKEEVVWWSNFNSLKRHYDENGSLTVRCTRLSSWLTCQRHDAKTLSKEMLQALESIGCKTTKAHRERYVKDWEEKCNEIKKLNPHVRDRKVQMWLNRQRLLAVSDRLSPTREQ